MQGLTFDIIPLMGYCFTANEHIIKNEDGSIDVMLNSDFCRKYLDCFGNGDYIYYLNVSPTKAELWRADVADNYETILTDEDIIAVLPDPLLDDLYINIKTELFNYLFFKNDNMFFYYP